MNALNLDLQAMLKAILSADLDTRIEVEDLLGAPITAPVDARWLKQALAGSTPARLVAVAHALRGAVSFAEEMDPDGFDFLRADVDLDGADPYDTDITYSLDSGGCGCRGGGAYGGGSHHPCRDCGHPAVHACSVAAAELGAA